MSDVSSNFERFVNIHVHEDPSLQAHVTMLHEVVLAERSPFRIHLLRKDYMTSLNCIKTQAHFKQAMAPFVYLFAAGCLLQRVSREDILEFALDTRTGIFELWVRFFTMYDVEQWLQEGVLAFLFHLPAQLEAVETFFRLVAEVCVVVVSLCRLETHAGCRFVVGVLCDSGHSPDGVLRRQGE